MTGSRNSHWSLSVLGPRSRCPVSWHNVWGERERRRRGTGPRPRLACAALAGAGVAEQVVVAFLVVGLDRAELLEPGATMSAGYEVSRAAPATAVLVVIHHACKVIR